MQITIEIGGKSVKYTKSVYYALTKHKPVIAKDCCNLTNIYNTPKYSCQYLLAINFL